MKRKYFRASLKGKGRYARVVCVFSFSRRPSSLWCIGSIDTLSRRSRALSRKTSRLISPTSTRVCTATSPTRASRRRLRALRRKHPTSKWRSRRRQRGSRRRAWRRPSIRLWNHSSRTCSTRTPPDSNVRQPCRKHIHSLRIHMLRIHSLRIHTHKHIQRLERRRRVDRRTIRDWTIDARGAKREPVPAVIDAGKGTVGMMNELHEFIQTNRRIVPPNTHDDLPPVVPVPTDPSKLRLKQFALSRIYARNER